MTRRAVTISVDTPPFPANARRAVNDAQLRRNIRNALARSASGARPWCIPTVVVKLRHDVVQAQRPSPEDALFAAASAMMKGRRRWSLALRLVSQLRWLRHGGPPPVSRWTVVRYLPEPSRPPFRDWWVNRYREGQR